MTQTRIYTAAQLLALADSHKALKACLRNLVQRDLIKDKDNDHFDEVLEVLDHARKVQP